MVALATGLLTDTSASVVVSDPGSGPTGGPSSDPFGPTGPTGGPTGAWLQYSIRLCQGNTCTQKAACTKAQPTDTSATCDLGLLSPFTAYTVVAVAESGEVLSSEGSLAFTTRIS